MGFLRIANQTNKVTAVTMSACRYVGNEFL